MTQFSSRPSQTATALMGGVSILALLFVVACSEQEVAQPDPATVERDAAPQETVLTDQSRTRVERQLSEDRADAVLEALTGHLNTKKVATKI